jgi:hypothetical protein
MKLPLCEFAIQKKRPIATTVATWNTLTPQEISREFNSLLSIPLFEFDNHEQSVIPRRMSHFANQLP